jgi:hypothetical protein
MIANPEQRMLACFAEAMARRHPYLVRLTWTKLREWHAGIDPGTSNLATVFPGETGTGGNGHPRREGEAA